MASHPSSPLADSEQVFRFGTYPAGATPHSAASPAVPRSPSPEIDEVVDHSGFRFGSLSEQRAELATALANTSEEYYFACARCMELGEIDSNNVPLDNLHRITQANEARYAAMAALLVALERAHDFDQAFGDLEF